MRKITQNIVGVVSLGVLVTSWSIGQAAESGLVVSAPAATETPTSGATPEPSATPTASASASASATAAPTASKKPSATAASVTKKSDAITYVAEKRQGIMQISVTKNGSTITAVKIISGGTEGGDYASIPNSLAKAAVQSQGANFGNVAHATHTTDAFYAALESALAKF